MQQYILKYIRNYSLCCNIRWNPDVAFDSKTWLGLVSMYPALILECKTIGKKPKPNPKVILCEQSEALHAFAQQWVQFSTVVILEVVFMGGRVPCLFSSSEVCASYLTFPNVFLGALGRQTITYKWNKIAPCMLLRISVTTHTWELKVELNGVSDFCLQTARRSEFHPFFSCYGSTDWSYWRRHTISSEVVNNLRSVK